MNKYAFNCDSQCVFLLTLLLQSFVSTTDLHYYEKSYQGIRSPKWLPLIVIIRNEPCNSTDSHEIGTCSTMTQCKSASGLPKGKCGVSGFGVCCVTVTSCSEMITKNNTYFRNKQFPDPLKPNAHQVCRTKIKKPNANICQVLLTFHDMELVPGSNDHGHCLVDNILLFGITNANLPHLCGSLSKQHMYLEYEPGHQSQITFTIMMDGYLDTSGRKWNVQVSFIRCDDPHRAPSGCLQYYTGSRGSVQSLGYPQAPHLAGLQYTICVRKEQSAESIFWFPCRDVPFEKSFHLLGPNIYMTSLSLVWSTCVGDYITIMSDADSFNLMQNTPLDRYCGNRLTPSPPFYINSRAVPYIIVVRTDLEEDETERENVGFCLEWYQVIWKPDNYFDGMLPELNPDGDGV